MARNERQTHPCNVVEAKHNGESRIILCRWRRFVVLRPLQLRVGRDEPIPGGLGRKRLRENIGDLFLAGWTAGLCRVAVKPQPSDDVDLGIETGETEHVLRR